MRRHHLVAVTALAALVPAGAAVASVPPDTSPGSSPPSEPAPTDSGAMTEPAASMPADTSSGSAPPGSAPTGDTTAAPAGEVTVYDDEGTAIATVVVSAIEAGWTDYGDDDTPEEGHEYLRVTAAVTSSVSDGTFGVAIDDFVLQDAHGFLETAGNVPTAAQVESDEDIVEEADLANGESVELALTFEVDPTIGAQSVFYHPDDDRLVDVAEVA